MHPEAPPPMSWPSWLPDWLKTGPGATPAAAAPAYTPPPETTPQEGAQRVIARYWRWAAAGAPSAPSTTEKDTKGNPVYYPVDPDTGQPDPNFPTIADITAARNELAASQKNDPQATAKMDADLKETQARTAQIQQQIDKGNKPAGPPATVQPGEGVWNPDKNGPGQGGYDVPVPTKPPAAPGPGKTQAQIDQEAADAHNKSVRDAANSQTPQQVLADKQAEIRTTAEAQWQARVAEKQALIDKGIELSAKDQEELKFSHDQIIADAKVKNDQATAQFTHDLNQPNVQAGIDISKQNADTQAASQASSARFQQAQTDQADRNQQSDVLKTQAAAGSDFINQGIKLGVTSSMGSVHMALDPLMMALHLTRQSIANGTLPPTAMPTPQAPQPAAQQPPMTAPLPATPPPMQTAPAPAAYSGAM